MTTIHFDEKCVPNHDYVVVRIIDNAEQLKFGGLILSDNAFANEKLAFGKIEAVGKNAAKEYGLEAGQYCLFDRLSTFYHTAPVCIVHYNNIIVLTNSDKSEYFPVKGTMFVDETKENVKEKNGILLRGGADESMHTGKIVQLNLHEEQDFPFKLGDTIMLVKGGDFVKINGKTIYIYKPDSVIVKINEND